MRTRETKAAPRVEPVRVPRFWTAVVLIWLLSVLLRILSLAAFGDGTPAGEQGAQMVIHTHDSGYHGYQAQAFLGQAEPRGPYTLAAVLPAVLSLVTPLSLDVVLFFLPVLLAPLVVFPMAWLGRRWIADLPALGLALVSSFLAGLYQRSHAGYYDTDILNVFFPLMIVVLFVRMAEDVRVRWLVWAVVLALLYDWWYGSARAMLFALAGGLCVHTLLYARTLPSRWQALIVFGLAVVPLPPAVRLPGLLLLMLALHVVLPRLTPGYKPAAWLARQTVLWLAPVALLVFAWLAAGGAAQIQSQVATYLGKTPTIDVQSAKGTLHFAAATGTIVESTGVSASLYAKTFAGQVLLGWISLAGLALLLWRVRDAILLLPLVLMGLIGFSSGIRFAIYLAPVALLGFAWGVYQLVRRLAPRDMNLPGLICLVFLLAPAWFHGGEVLRWNRQVALPVFDAGQVEALRAAAQRDSGASRWAFAWWDYGWPLWHYGQWKTIVDNGTHGDADSYLVSRAISSTNQAELAGLALLTSGEKARQPGQQAISGLLQRYGEIDGIMSAARGLNQTNTHGALVAASSTIVFPWQMRYLFYTIDKFSRRDLATGRLQDDKAVWMLGRVIERKGERVTVAQTLAPRVTSARPRFVVDETSGLVEMHEGKTRLSRLVRVSWQAGKRIVSERLYPAGDQLTLVEDEHGVILMHERYYHSNYVQMALLGRVDSTLFDVVYQGSTLLLAETRVAGR